MIRGLAIFACILCNSCVMTNEDSFVVMSGLQNIDSREHLFERDVRLNLVSHGPFGTAFDTLSPQTQSCVISMAVNRATPALLAAADGFLARKSETTWNQYRSARAREDAVSKPDDLLAAIVQCEAPAVSRMAARSTLPGNGRNIPVF